MSSPATLEFTGLLAELKDGNQAAEARVYALVVSEEQTGTIMALDEAGGRQEQLDPRQSKIVDAWLHSEITT